MDQLSRGAAPEDRSGESRWGKNEINLGNLLLAARGSLVPDQIIKADEIYFFISITTGLSVFPYRVEGTTGYRGEQVYSHRFIAKLNYPVLPSKIFFRQIYVFKPELSKRINDLPRILPAGFYENVMSFVYLGLA